MSASFAAAVLSSSVVSGTSLYYAASGELVGERAGVVNLGLEGLMLIGAAEGFAATSLSGNPYAGVVAAGIACLLANLIFGFLVIERRANQLASGLSLMFFGFGASTLIGRPFVGALVPALPRIAAAGIGSFDVLVWLVVPTAFCFGGSCFAHAGASRCARSARTRPQRLRPGDVQSGCNTRRWRLLDFLAGVGGAHLSVGLTQTWDEGMTAGRGFIAIALVIFSKWNPLWVIVGALVFGGAETLQLQLQARGADVSPFLMTMVPYLLTLLILAFWGWSRRSVAPAALGRNFFGVE